MYILHAKIHKGWKEHSYLYQGRDHANGDAKLGRKETGIRTHGCLITAVAHEQKSVQHLVSIVLSVCCVLQYAVAVVVAGPALGHHENSNRLHAGAGTHAGKGI
jgi:hypothetical protein